MAAAPPITKAFQWDLARQVERLDFLLRWLPRYAEWGYQELYLHLEDAVAYPSLPGVARSDAYTPRELGRLVDAATAVGIRVVPIVNLLGHTQYLIKVPELRDLNELRDASDRPLERGQICPLHPRTLEIAEKLLRDVAPFCTAGKVHVGLDESFLLGRCPRCRAEIARRGLAAHFAGHVGRLHGLTRSLGLRLGLWADMLALLPAAIPQLPRDVIAYDWYYYPFARLPRVELHNFAEVDLATPLQARGIEYWGCPMDGAFRHEPLPAFGERLANMVSWWRRCRRVGASGFLVTSWEPNRLAIELTMAIDAAAASLWLNPDVDDPREMLARGFERAFGRIQVGRLVPKPPRRVKDNAPYPAEARHWARAAMACDKFAFAGHHRWQINRRWDVCLGRDGGAAYQREQRYFDRLCGSPDRPRWPLPLAASVAFRRYLAQRDVFVRRNAAAVFRLRRLLSTPRAMGARGLLAQLGHQGAAFAQNLRTGRAAARAIWNRSRDSRQRGPNELMVAADADRLREWRTWLRKARKHPAVAWQTTPACGAWQLQFIVHNFAPAVQRVVVEQRQPDGSWRTLHELSMIEFRAFAAQPRAQVRREISVPIDDPRAALRLAVRGVGQVAVSRVELTNGVVRGLPIGWPATRRKILGAPAPRRGLPRVDFERNTAVTVRFSQDGPWRRVHG